jgi:hypothetical protein
MSRFRGAVALPIGHRWGHPNGLMQCSFMETVPLALPSLPPSRIHARARAYARNLCALGMPGRDGRDTTIENAGPTSKVQVGTA